MQDRITRRKLLKVGALAGGSLLAGPGRAGAQVASITSARSGDWHDPTTWVGGVVPGVGSGVVIAAGHTVRIPAGNLVTVGPDLLGGVAITVKSPGGALVVEADLTLLGDLVYERGTTVAVRAPAEGGLLVLFDPAPGNQHVIRHQNVGTGTAVLELGGTPASRVRVETSARGGANGRVVANAAPSACVLAHVTFERVGTSSADAVAARTTGSSSPVLWTGVRAKGCGRLFIDGYAGAARFEVDGLDLRSPLGSSFFRVQAQVDKSPGGVRKLQRVSAYAASRKSFEVFARDLDVCRAIHLVNASLGNNGDRRNVLEEVWFLAAVSGCSVGVAPNGGSRIRNSAFVTRASNPHYVKESGASAGLAANVVEGCVFDGDGYVGSDAGDCVIPMGSVVFRHNLVVNKAGTIGSMIYRTGSITALNNTAHRAFHLALGETNGHPGQCLAFRNNLVVGQAYAVRQWGAFVRQAGFESDYNVTYGLTSGDRLGAGGLRVPYAKQVGSVSCTDGTGPATVVAAAATFLTAGVLPGDFFANSTRRATARILSVDSETQLTLAHPIAGQAPGDVGSVTRSYWATPGAQYGEEGRGLHDFSVDPMFHDPARTARAFDLARGGAGTLDSLAAEIVKLNGWDRDGVEATYDPAYSVGAFLEYMRAGFTPTNSALVGAGAPVDGHPDIGAIPIAG